MFQANAEERAARAAAGEGDSDASDSEPKKVTKPGQPIRVSKKDLAVAKQKVDGMQQKQKLLAKSFKKDQKNADLEIEEQPQKQSKRKAEVEAADEGGDYLDQNELAASVSQLSGAARKKFKQSISEAEASRFASRKKRGTSTLIHHSSMICLSEVFLFCTLMFQIPIRSALVTARPAQSNVLPPPMVPRSRSVSRARRHSRARQSTSAADKTAFYDLLYNVCTAHKSGDSRKPNCYQ
jgi:hypothetical protein